MSPEALELARSRVALELHGSAALFRHAAAQEYADFSGRGVGTSSMMVLAIHELCSTELRSRAQIAWKVCQRILTADAATPDDQTRAEVLSLLAQALDVHSGDVDQVYTLYSSRMEGEWPDLKGARQAATLMATSELDIDLLQRRRKHLPLGDILRAPRYASCYEHWTRAREAGECDPVDTLIALREGVLAVEALAKLVAPGGGATLGDCIKSLRAKKLLDAGADKLLEGLWVYANAVPGTRHGSPTTASLLEQDWQVLRPMLEGALTLLLGLDRLPKLAIS